MNKVIVKINSKQKNDKQKTIKMKALANAYTKNGILYVIYKEKDLLVMFPPTKYTNSIIQLGIPYLHLDKHKPKWNKSLMESVIEINGKTYRKPIEWN